MEGQSGVRGVIGFLATVVGLAGMWYVLSGQHLPFEK